MNTNADMTLYNRYIDPTTRAEKYQRVGIASVKWENTAAANGRSSGLLAANLATVYIPFARGENYVKPKAWQLLSTKTGKWTLQNGDVIVKGIVTDEITTSPVFNMTDLKAKYDDVLTVTSVDTMDIGSANMRHWQLGAK